MRNVQLVSEISPEIYQHTIIYRRLWVAGNLSSHGIHLLCNHSPDNWKALQDSKPNDRFESIKIAICRRSLIYCNQFVGLILSGNEISQILLSVILSYIGGNSNRPRFIAIGVIFCALSCFILASPHFIYGAGEDALKLTKEYADAQNISHVSLIFNTKIWFFSNGSYVNWLSHLSQSVTLFAIKTSNFIKLTQF